MATAIKTTAEPLTRSPHQQLVLSSLCGALYILFTLGLVFAGLPMAWQLLGIGASNPHLSSALLVLVSLVTLGGLWFLGLKLEGSHPVPGARAGAFVGAGLLLLTLLIALGIGNSWLIGNPRSPNMEPGAALAFTAVVGAGLLFLIGWTFVKPAFGQWLVRLEESGWFHAVAFKPNQGLRVRRGTVFGLIVVGLCGIVTLIQHHSLTGGAWTVDIPGTALMVPIMFAVNVNMVIVLLFATFWVAWRVVNWPAFADFLIATEAEINKVSWTTRKRLVQDTVVVLVTVFLMTLFLFFVDVFWIRALNAVGVLTIDTQEIRAKQNTEQQW